MEECERTEGVEGEPAHAASAKPFTVVTFTWAAAVSEMSVEEVLSSHRVSIDASTDV